MKWVWEWDNWPQYSIWSGGDLADLESGFLKDARLASETLGRMDSSTRKGIEAELLAREAVMTSKIENVDLDHNAVLLSLRHLMGLDTDSSATGSYEMSVARFTLDVHLNFAEPLTAERLFSWHETLMAGHPEVRDVGKYRTEGSMVASGSPGNYTVHYVAPPPSRVPDDMKRFLDGFNAVVPKQGEAVALKQADATAPKQADATAPKQADAISILTRAALAHLQFVQIHPFEDGNGRISRAIVDTAIAKALGMSTPVKMSHDIFENRGEYYETLGRAGTDPMVTDWVMYIAHTGTMAAERTLRRIGEDRG